MYRAFFRLGGWFGGLVCEGIIFGFVLLEKVFYYIALAGLEGPEICLPLPEVLRLKVYATCSATEFPGDRCRLQRKASSGRTNMGSAEWTHQV